MHRNLLLPCPYLPSEAKKALPGKPLQIKQKVDNAEPQMHEPFVTAENVEDRDFQTFLPSQLQELDTYFVNSSVNDSAAEDHLDLAPTTADTAVNSENLENCPPDSPHIETDSTQNKADSTLDSNLVDSEAQATDTDFSPANVRPQRFRQPPMMLSYHNLGNPIDMQAGIITIGNRLNYAAFPSSNEVRLIPPPPYFYQPYNITPSPMLFTHQMPVLSFPLNYFNGLQQYQRVPILGY